MNVGRRQAILRLFGVGGTVTAALATPAHAVEHRPHPEAPADAVAMLYDNTLCIGCKACMSACNEANGLTPDTKLSSGLSHMPLDLNPHAKTVIKLYKEPQSTRFAFVKRQCMHCVDPACVTGCPFGALQKNAGGAVTWDGSRCIGCRYCEVACPFDVPKFEWDRWNPKIVKCELCFEQRLQHDRQPACTEVCPTSAVVFGKRTDLLATAKQRVGAAPGKYFEDRVYGEHEVGGTQVLYLSAIAFEKLGLPKLGPTSLAYYATAVSSVAYRWLSGPLIAAAVLGAIIKRNWNRHEAERPERERRTGLPDQL